mgnify:FL=1
MEPDIGGVMEAVLRPDLAPCGDSWLAPCSHQQTRIERAARQCAIAYAAAMPCYAIASLFGDTELGGPVSRCGQCPACFARQALALYDSQAERV